MIKKIWETSVVLGDTHYPFHDVKAVNLVLAFIKWFQPDKIFLNGDIVDCWDISSFDKPVSIENRLKDELEQVRHFLKLLREYAPHAESIYIFGNHEYRFEKYVSRFARNLAGLEGLTLEEQLHLKELNVITINGHLRENFYRYGYLLIGHFNRVNKFSAYTAKNLLEEKGMSLIQNHTHRGGTSYKRDYRDTKIACENFCLCDLNPPYLQIPNWQLGFSTIFTNRKTKLFKIVPMEIIEYSLIPWFEMLGFEKK